MRDGFSHIAANAVFGAVFYHTVSWVDSGIELCQIPRTFLLFCDKRYLYLLDTGIGMSLHRQQII